MKVMNQFLLALCGLPASGKSVLADSIAKRLESDVEIVSTDDWRDDDYYKDWRPEKEGLVRNQALQSVRDLLLKGISVIHDDTNYYKSMRHELFDIALDSKCIFAVVHVTTPLEVALEWNRRRDHSPIDDEIIRGIDERLDAPGGRYLWDQPIAEVDMSAADVESVSIFIVDLLEELPPATRPKPVRVSLTVADEIDVFTREVVSEFLRENPALRTNSEVTLIRRAILSKAMTDNLPARVAGRLLREELEGLLGESE